MIFADSSEGGEDVLFGGADSDILVSGTGRDFLSGGDGIDAASWQEASTAVMANIAVGGAISAGVGIENLIGSRFGDNLRGDNTANQLFGGDGGDKLFGEGGNDFLSGGSGNDMLDGGAGGNSMLGGTGVDTADYLGLSGGVDVSLRERNASADDRFDSLNEIEAVRGSNFADTIEGDKFGNQLSGMSSADMIAGGEGDDVLTGGTGADVFVFEASDIDDKTRDPFDAGFDRITDLGAGDRIDLTGHFEAMTFAALRGEASQFGTDTHLRLGEDTIVLEEVALSDLSAGTFLF